MIFEQNSFKLIELLTKNGFQAVYVGGCVRDHLLGLIPKDYDIATSATPDEVLNILFENNIHSLEVGKQFGVVKALIDNIEYEIATFRSDGKYSDGRRPDSVEFSTIEFDSTRRDLTINALYYDPIINKLYDFHGGEEDLRNKKIKFVGDCYSRISEDRLRILRALRFAIKFEFEIDENEFKILKRYSYLVLSCARERIQDELFKGFQTNPVKYFNLLKKCELCVRLFGFEVTGKYVNYITKVDKTLANILALIFLECDDYRSVPQHLNELFRLSDDVRSETYYLYDLCRWEYPKIWSKLDAYLKLNSPYWHNAKNFLISIGLFESMGYKRYIEINNINEEFLSQKRIVTGSDLLNLGYKPSEKFGMAIKEAFSIQINQGITDKEILLNHAKIFIENY